MPVIVKWGGGSTEHCWFRWLFCWLFFWFYGIVVGDDAFVDVILVPNYSPHWKIVLLLFEIWRCGPVISPSIYCCCTLLNYYTLHWCSSLFWPGGDYSCVDVDTIVTTDYWIVMTLLVFVERPVMIRSAVEFWAVVGILRPSGRYCWSTIPFLPRNFPTIRYIRWIVVPVHCSRLFWRYYTLVPECSVRFVGGRCRWPWVPVRFAGTIELRWTTVIWCHYYYLTAGNYGDLNVTDRYLTCCWWTLLFFYLVVPLHCTTFCDLCGDLCRWIPCSADIIVISDRYSCPRWWPLPLWWLWRLYVGDIVQWTVLMTVLLFCYDFWCWYWPGMFVVTLDRYCWRKVIYLGSVLWWLRYLFVTCWRILLVFWLIWCYPHSIPGRLLFVGLLPVICRPWRIFYSFIWLFSTLLYSWFIVLFCSIITITILVILLFYCGIVVIWRYCWCILLIQEFDPMIYSDCSVIHYYIGYHCSVLGDIYFSWILCDAVELLQMEESVPFWNDTPLYSPGTLMIIHYCRYRWPPVGCSCWPITVDIIVTLWANLLLFCVFYLLRFCSIPYYRVPLLICYRLLNTICSILICVVVVGRWPRRLRAV